jgi:thiamine monophosphate synthase
MLLDIKDWITFILALLALGVSILAWRESRRNAKAAEDSAAASLRSAKAAEDSVVIADRNAKAAENKLVGRHLGKNS